MKIISFPPVADVGMTLEFVIFLSFAWPIFNNLVFWLVTLGNSIVPLDREMLRHALVTNKESKIHSDWSFIFSLQANVIERGKCKINQQIESITYYDLYYQTKYGSGLQEQLLKLTFILFVNVMSQTDVKLQVLVDFWIDTSLITFFTCSIFSPKDLRSRDSRTRKVSLLFMFICHKRLKELSNQGWKIN